MAKQVEDWKRDPWADALGFQAVRWEMTMEDVLNGRCPWKGAWVWATAGRVSSQVPLPCSWEVRCPLQSWAWSHTQVQPSPPSYSQAGRQAPRCLTTAHGSRTPWAISVGPHGAHLLFGTCYLGGGVLYSLFFSVTAPPRGWIISLIRKRQKNMYVHAWVHCGMSTNIHYMEQHRHSCERFMFLLRFLGAQDSWFSLPLYH